MRHELQTPWKDRPAGQRDRLWGEWLERHEESESIALLKYAHSKGINIIDCWMPDPESRDIIGQAIEEDRAGWVVQGHIGSTHQNGQYTRTRDAEQCRIAFEDLLTRLKTDYIDLGNRDAYTDANTALIRKWTAEARRIYGKRY